MKDVLLQKPNLPLKIAIAAFWTGLLFKILKVGPLYQLALVVFLMAYAAWAYLEAISGTHWIRKMLGALVLIAVLAYLFYHLH